MFTKKFQNIEFISEDKYIMSEIPPLPAKKLVPDWYKELDKETEVDKISQFGHDWPTIKKCMPVQDFLTSGYIIRNTNEIEITKVQEFDGKHDNNTKCNDPNFVGKHPHSQCPVEIDGAKMHYFKFNQPWAIKTPPGYSCFIYQPFYLFERRFTILPAIVDTDNHDIPVSLPAINNMPVGHTYSIKPYEPLCVVYPFKRENWTHSVSSKPLWPESKLRMWLRDGYKIVHHAKKIFK